jgi:hypothetical protein
VATALKVGERVRVADKLHVLSEIDPPMHVYKGQEGTVIQLLPAEMGFESMKRVQFDDPALGILAFMARELIRI